MSVAIDLKDLYRGLFVMARAWGEVRQFHR